MIKSSMVAPSGSECLSSINGERNRERAVDYKSGRRSIVHQRLGREIATYLALFGVWLGCSVGSETSTTCGVSDDGDYADVTEDISAI